jgi:2-dehydro-3-deoxyphosphogalactonate aldolase
VSDKDFAEYGKIGVSTFGLGSSLYTPGLTAEAVAGRALAAVAEWDAVFARAQG